MKPVLGFMFLLSFVLSPTLIHAKEESKFLISIKAKTAKERNQISDLGIAIEHVMSDRVMAIVGGREISILKASNLPYEMDSLPEVMRKDFPSEDKKFHNYKEVEAVLKGLAGRYPRLVQVGDIGESLEGRKLYSVRLSSRPESDSLPTAVLMGCHHAREHLSVEVPLKMATYLAENYDSDDEIRNLLDTREVWIVPMVNPDGAEYDISGRGYKYWRKNRRKNHDGSYGVDLNRNYGKGFGGSGSSASTWSDIYHGPQAFSEPETQAVRDFLKDRNKTTVLISFHTFSELVLWPWGFKDEVISNQADREVFETMGRKMASWNGYTPQKSSDLYVASGDTTDWAYDELGIFAFTFELSPSSMFGGGFYPGAKAIEPTFNANIQPILYLIEKAENPYAVRKEVPSPLSLF